MKISVHIINFIIVIITLNLALANFIIVSSGPADAESTGYIMGRVMLPDGATGIGDCRITLLSHDGKGLSMLSTDSLGNFCITNVVPANGTSGYCIKAEKPGWGESTTQPFNVYANTSTRVAIRMYATIGTMALIPGSDKVPADGASTVDILLEMKDLSGKPIPDGYHVTFSQQSYYPDPGYFVAEDNETTITVPVSGGSAKVRYGLIPRDSLSRSVVIKAVVNENPENYQTDELIIDIVSPNVITGVVYDADRKPVPYARLNLEKWDGVSKFEGYNSSEERHDSKDGTAVADENGVYRYEVLPVGDYRVTASESSFKNTTDLKVVSGIYRHDIVIQGLKRGDISGRIFDADSRPVPGANIILSRINGDIIEHAGSAVTGSDGSFTFKDVRYGSYNLESTLGGSTANAPLWLDVEKASVTMKYMTAIPVEVSPTVEATPGPTVTEVTITPTPVPEEPVSPIYSFGIAIFSLTILCGLLLAIALSVARK